LFANRHIERRHARETTTTTTTKMNRGGASPDEADEEDDEDIRCLEAVFAIFPSMRDAGRADSVPSGPGGRRERPPPPAPIVVYGVVEEDGGKQQRRRQQRIIHAPKATTTTTVNWEDAAETAAASAPKATTKTTVNWEDAAETAAASAPKATTKTTVILEDAAETAAASAPKATTTTTVNWEDAAETAAVSARSPKRPAEPPQIRCSDGGFWSWETLIDSVGVPAPPSPRQRGNEAKLTPPTWTAKLGDSGAADAADAAGKKRSRGTPLLLLFAAAAEATAAQARIRGERVAAGWDSSSSSSSPPPLPGLARGDSSNNNNAPDVTINIPREFVSSRFPASRILAHKRVLVASGAQWAGLTGSRLPHHPKESGATTTAIVIRADSYAVAQAVQFAYTGAVGACCFNNNNNNNNGAAGPSSPWSRQAASSERRVLYDCGRVVLFAESIGYGLLSSWILSNPPGPSHVVDSISFAFMRYMVRSYGTGIPAADDAVAPPPTDLGAFCDAATTAATTTVGNAAAAAKATTTTVDVGPQRVGDAAAKATTTTVDVGPQRVGDAAAAAKATTTTVDTGPPGVASCLVGMPLDAARSIINAPRCVGTSGSSNNNNNVAARFLDIWVEANRDTLLRAAAATTAPTAILDEIVSLASSLHLSTDYIRDMMLTLSGETAGPASGVASVCALAPRGETFLQVIGCAPTQPAAWWVGAQ
jgi:hypothetical protein